MNWTLILSLSGFGLAMGLASVWGLTHGIEGMLWLAIGIVCATWIARKMPTSPFRHGLAVGVIGGGLSPLIQSLFFPVYALHNPDVVGTVYQFPGGLSMRAFFFALTPAIGITSGLALGLLAWTAGRILHQPRESATPVSR
jgi:hypothetical protein